MTQEDAFASLKELCAHCSPPAWEGCDRIALKVVRPGLTIGQLVRLDKAEIYSRFEEQALQRKLDKEQNKEAIPAGAEFTLQVPRSLTWLAVVQDLQGLLSINGSIKRDPDAYIIVDPSDGLSLHLRGESTRELPIRFQRYHQANALWELLESKCDHPSITGDKLLFFDGIRKVEIRPVISTVSDVDYELRIPEIRAFCSSDDNVEVRSDIFCAELSDLLKDSSPSTAFRTLIRNNSKFSRRLREGLAVYLATKRPAKLLDEARNAGLSFSEKAEKIVAGIELKALAVPAAMLLAIKDIEKGLGFTAVNSIFFGGALLFSAMMFLVFRSQISLIETLKSSITAAEREFQERGLDSRSPDIQFSFSSLCMRLGNARIGAVAVLVLSFLPAFCILMLMLYAAPASTQKTQQPAPVGVTSHR